MVLFREYSSSVCAIGILRKGVLIVQVEDVFAPITGKFPRYQPISIPGRLVSNVQDSFLAMQTDVLGSLGNTVSFWNSASALR